MSNKTCWRADDEATPPNVSRTRGEAGKFGEKRIDALKPTAMTREPFAVTDVRAGVAAGRVTEVHDEPGSGAEKANPEPYDDISEPPTAIRSGDGRGIVAIEVKSTPWESRLCVHGPASEVVVAMKEWPATTKTSQSSTAHSCLQCIALRDDC
jgi:hypothetical protein